MKAVNYCLSDQFSSLNVVVRGTKRQNSYSVTSSANVLTEDMRINRDLLFAIAREIPLTKDSTFVCEVVLRTIINNNRVVDVICASFKIDVVQMPLTAITFEVSVLNNKRVEKMSHTFEASKSVRGANKKTLDSGPLCLKAISDLLRAHRVKIVRVASESTRKSATDIQIEALRNQIQIVTSLRKDDNATAIDDLVKGFKTQIANLTKKQNDARKAREARKANKNADQSVHTA